LFPPNKAHALVRVSSDIKKNAQNIISQPHIISPPHSLTERFGHPRVRSQIRDVEHNQARVAHEAGGLLARKLENMTVAPAAASDSSATSNKATVYHAPSWSSRRAAAKSSSSASSAAADDDDDHHHHGGSLSPSASGMCHTRRQFWARRIADISI
jgi:hypothetical protein